MNSKSLYTLTVFFWIFSFVASIPIPTSRPPTPTPENDPSVPLPGRSGIDVQPGKPAIVTAFYGDADLQLHAKHVQDNQAMYPSNRNPMLLADNLKVN